MDIIGATAACPGKLANLYRGNKATFSELYSVYTLVKKEGKREAINNATMQSISSNLVGETDERTIGRDFCGGVRISEEQKVLHAMSRIADVSNLTRCLRKGICPLRDVSL